MINFQERQWKNFLEKYCTEDTAIIYIYWHVIITMLVWLPLIIILICYILMFIKVRCLCFSFAYFIFSVDLSSDNYYKYSFFNFLSIQKQYAQNSGISEKLIEKCKNKPFQETEKFPYSNQLSDLQKFKIFWEFFQIE